MPLAEHFVKAPDWTWFILAYFFLAGLSGGSYALAAARALTQNTDLDARSVVEKALNIAADICIYTNRNLTIEELQA